MANAQKGGLGVSLWKTIRYEWLTFSKSIQFNIGDGT